MAVAPVAQRRSFRLGGLPARLGQLVETFDLQEEPPETQAEEVTLLGEQMAEGRAAPLNPRWVVANRERHRRLFPGDVEIAEEPTEMRVGHFVEDHEPRVHRLRPSPLVRRHVDGVRMAAGTRVPVEDRHVMVRREKVEAT